MSAYLRTTRECPVSQLHPELLQPIQEYFQEHRLGHLESETLICCETFSQKKEAGRTGSWLSGKPDTTIYTGIVLTSEWLIWVHFGDQSGIRLNAAHLSRIRAELYTPPFIQESGLRIAGYIEGANTLVRGYIAMGTGSVVQKFCEEVRQATVNANPSPKRDWSKWLMR